MKIRRYLRATILFLFVFITFLCIPAFAAETEYTQDQILGNMDALALGYVYTLRGVICPLAIISLASCGFKILFAVFAGGRADMPKIKKQIVWTVIGIVVYALLPLIMRTVIATLRSAAWKPA